MSIAPGTAIGFGGTENSAKITCPLAVPVCWHCFTNLVDCEAETFVGFEDTCCDDMVSLVVEVSMNNS